MLYAGYYEITMFALLDTLYTDFETKKFKLHLKLDKEALDEEI